MHPLFIHIDFDELSIISYRYMNECGHEKIIMFGYCEYEILSLLLHCHSIKERNVKASCLGIEQQISKYFSYEKDSFFLFVPFVFISLF